MLQTYECSDIEVFEDSDNPPTRYEWNDSPFSQTEPKNACHAPVRPVVQVNQSHIALVPTYSCGWRQDCTYITKADNLGSSGYVAYITWDERECEKSKNGVVGECGGGGDVWVMLASVDVNMANMSELAPSRDAPN